MSENNEPEWARRLYIVGGVVEMSSKGNNTDKRFSVSHQNK